MNNTVLEQLLSTANPFGTILNTIDVSRLPTLSEDARKNKTAWNTIGSTTSTAFATALAVALMHRMNKKKWEKKNKDILKNKVNSLYPITAPNYSEQLSSVSDVRNLGLNNITKEAAYDPQSGRGFFDWSVDTIKDTVTAGLPVAASITAMAVTPAIINKYIEKKEAEKLDQEILERRNKLAALQAKYIELGIQKNSSAHEYEGFSPYSIMLGVTGAGASSLLGLAIYKYLNKNDNNRKVMETLEDIIAENSTNIPQHVSLKLDNNGKPARTRKDQVYIEDMKKAIDSSDKNVDFDDKITKVEKDALFS